MASLIAEQNATFEDITIFMRNFRKDNHVVKSKPHYWNKRQAIFEELWQRIRDRHALILSARSSDPKLKENEYFQQNIYSKISEECLAYSVEMEDERILRCNEPPTPIPQQNSPTRPTPLPRSIDIKLPAIDLPHFNGDFKEWIQFRDSFTSMVDSRTGLSNVDKLNYLKSCLVGSAKDLLSSYTITDANYPLAWGELKTTYNNNRKLILAQLTDLLDAPFVQKDTAGDLKKLVHTVKRSLQSLQSLQISTENWDPLLVAIITRRLPTETLRAWEQGLSNPMEFPTWKQLSTFLDERLRTLEAIEDSLALNRSSNATVSAPKKFNQPLNVSKNSKNLHSYAAVTPSANRHCVICRSNNHKLGHSCSIFKTMSLESRWDTVKSLHLCFNCLGRHPAGQCNSSSCLKCGARHHSLLHRDFNASQNNIANKSATTKAALTTKTFNPSPNNTKEKAMKSKSSVNDSSKLTSLPAKCQTSNSVLLGTILLKAEFKGKILFLRALIDTASQASFITEKSSKQLGLRPKHTKISISGIGNKNSLFSSKEVSLNISPHYHNDTQLPLSCIVIPKIVDFQSKVSLDANQMSSIKHLRLADPNFHKVNEVDVLLGADVYGEIVTGRILKGSPDLPTAIESHFGWILIGKVPSNRKPSNISSLISCIELNNQLKRFWEIEEPETVKHLSEEDQKCEEHFLTTHIRNPDGRYVVELPFRSESPELGESRNIALKRYERVERTLIAKGELDNYSSILNEYVDLDHVDKVSVPLNSTSPVVNSCYLPHHAVFKEESTSTRLRIVFDASCHTSNGRSLNDNLLTGPKLQTDIAEILTRWRFHKIVLTADISKMYRQILIAPQHRDFQRILIRRNHSSPVEDYRMNRVTFGVNCAPYLAIRVLHQLSADEAHLFPSASRIVKTDMYVDDLLTGANSIEEAEDIQKELLQLFEAGKFDLRKWGSNRSELLKSLPPEFINPKIQFTQEDCNVKTLGIKWEPKTDKFFFQTQASQLAISPVTKRKVLSVIAQIYDPLGWLAPIIIRCKIFMQQLWLHKYDWDDPLPTVFVESWNRFAQDFNHLEKISIPRWFQYSPSVNWEIHGFCDASEKAYAAVLYMRIINSSNKIFSKLIISKSKVAPVKTVSLPRLELCGAVILSRLLTKIINSLSLPVSNVFLWTDSTIVLNWIVKLPSTLKTFVANRVSEIQEKTEKYKWQHVRSKDNPADLASRGIPIDELISTALWWEGPSWLQQDSSFWPEQPKLEKTLEEVKSDQVISLLVQYDEQFYDRFSSFNKMVRVVSFMRRFFKENRSGDLLLTTKEINQTKNCLIRTIQSVSFSKELQALRNNSPISKDSLLKTLNPYLDKFQILRSKSRLIYSKLPYSEKCPVILPYGSNFTKLYVKEVHALTLHGGKQLMINIIRRQFWIPRIGRLVKSIINNCVTCIRFKQETQKQIMAPLPSRKLDARSCFSVVGMDYCGPFSHKLFEGRCPRISKCYILIIVCFFSKMIHLELVSDLTTEAFLAAFDRFISRRSLPEHIYCDNATYFVGANAAIRKQLAKAVQAAQISVSESFISKGVQFHFSPPSAPHFNGMAEAGVKSVKYHLKRVIGIQMFTFEKYCTIISKIEACLNSRPLAPRSDDPEDLTALTPSHLWSGKELLTLPENETTKDIVGPNKYWQIVNQTRQHFWKSWSRDYLHSLKARKKWHFSQPNATVGQMVLIMNELTPPQVWKLGRITEIHPGPDKQVRVVTVKSASGSYIRPVTKLVFLPKIE